MRKHKNISCLYFNNTGFAESMQDEHWVMPDNVF